jgi:small subunit ribosomal protein S17
MSEKNTTGHDRPTKQGVVTSNKMTKTITLKIERLVRHPLYGKFVRRSTKLHAHDELQEANIGDVVEVEFCRPMSKLKRWRLVRIVRRGSDTTAPVPGSDVVTEVTG